MNSRWIRWAVVGLLGMSTGVGAVFQSGPNGKPMRWNMNFYDAGLFPDQNPQTLAIRYHVASEGWSAANRVKELDSIRAAFALWESVPGTKVKFEESTPVSGINDISYLDGVNMVVWLNSNRMINGGLTHFPFGVTGITVLAGSGSDEIIAEADIVLNRDLPWFTEFEPGRNSGINVESVVLHEIGHWLGLNHAAVGGATMFWYATPGIGATAGLSSDDVVGVRAVYPAAGTQYARISGTISLNGAGFKGAVVTAEDPQGRVVAAVVSRNGGAYEMAGLPAGELRLRVTPLDPGASGDGYLVRGADLDTTTNFEFNSVGTDFLPKTNEVVTLAAGQSVTRNLALTAGIPPFRITETRRYLTPEGLSSGDETPQLRPGQTNAWVAVYVPGLAAGPATLRLTGDGIEYGTTEVAPKALRQLTRVQVPVSVSSNAAPGLRSLQLTVNGYTAWANGFVEILPTTYDFNGDGLDDLFQRKYFSPFTRAEARPTVDFDGDGFSNAREAAMGSDPTDRNSVNYRITSVKQTVSGTTLTWESGLGKKYQVLSRSRLENSPWEVVATGIASAGETTQWTDGRPGTEQRFYRVGDAP